MSADGSVLTPGSNVYSYRHDNLTDTCLVSLGSRSIISVTLNPVESSTGRIGTDQMYKYTGKPLTLTGLYYYGARWYNQSLGRFLTRDPNRGRLSNPQSLSLYVYVLNNPLRYTDPTGRDECSIFNWNTWGGCVNNTVSTVGNYVYNGASTLYNSGKSGVDWVVNKWNNDANFRTIVISVAVIVVVTVATAGLGDAFVAPVLFGATLGGGVSGAFYASTCGQSQGGCSVEGALSHILSGIALGAAGGLAGPVAGAFGGEEAGALSGLLLSRGGNSLIAGGAQALIDIAGGKSTTTTLTDVGLSAGIAAVTADDPGEIPAGSSQSFKQAANWLAEHQGASDVFGAMASAFGGEALDYLGPLLGW